MTGPECVRPVPRPLAELHPGFASAMPSESQHHYVGVTTADRAGPVTIEGFAQGLPLRLESCCDESVAGDFVTPVLVHGADVHVVDLTRSTVGPSDPGMRGLHRSEPPADRIRADALVVMTPVHKLNLGMRTADCLTWAFAAPLTPGASETSPTAVIMGLVHLGWRSLTAGLHWRVAATLESQLRSFGIDDPGAFWASAHHYLGPTIAGSDYRCGLNDVGVALDALPDVLRALPLDGPSERARQQRSSAPVVALARQLGGFSEEACFPDLQLLGLIDLLCLGARPESIVVHRVNTARSPHYPSYRRDERGRQDSGGLQKRRLVTLLRCPG